MISSWVLWLLIAVATVATIRSAFLARRVRRHKNARNMLSRGLCNYYERQAIALMRARSVSPAPTPLVWMTPDLWRLRAAMMYRSKSSAQPLTLLKRMKYGAVGWREARLIAARLALWYVEQYGLLDGSYTMIAYVPSSEESLKRRHFDQAFLIAQALSDAINIPCRSVLTRRRETERQVAVASEEARRANVDGLFFSEDVYDEFVLLIDDVATTGATLSACARALRASGARTVSALVLAAKPGPKA